MLACSPTSAPVTSTRPPSAFAASYDAPTFAARLPCRSIAGTDVFLKLECEQVTGSFKLRGAYNALASLAPERARARGHRRVRRQSRARHRVRRARARHSGNALRSVHRARREARGHRRARRQMDATSPDYDHALARAMAHAAEEGVPFVSATGDTT